MTTEFPSTRAAEQSEMAPWDQERYNIQKVTGKVEAVDMGYETTKGGTQIAFYQIHLSGCSNIEAITPVSGTTFALRQDLPRQLQFRQSEQGYFWLCKSAGVDNLGELVGKTLTFVYKFRPYVKDGFDRREHYYVVEDAGTNNGSTPTNEPTVEQMMAATTAVLELAPGKTRSQLNSAALKDSRIPQSLVTSGSLINELVDAGRLILGADGTFTVPLSHDSLATGLVVRTTL